jgi:hypothetical protein
MEKVDTTNKSNGTNSGKKDNLIRDRYVDNDKNTGSKNTQENQITTSICDTM